MSREHWIYTLLAIGSMLLLKVFVRRHKVREGLFAFLAAQFITWPGTIFMNYFGVIESPVRLFPKATESNFIVSFVFLPTVFVVYYLHYPKDKNRLLQMAYSLAFAGGSSIVHAAMQKYTDVLKYVTFSGVWGCLELVVGNYILRRYADWFFDQLIKRQAGNP